MVVWPAWLVWFAEEFVSQYFVLVLVLTVLAPLAFELVWFVGVLITNRRLVSSCCGGDNKRCLKPFPRWWLARTVFDVTKRDLLRHYKRELVDTFYLVHDTVPRHLVSYIPAMALAAGVTALFCLLEWLLAIICSVVLAFSFVYAILHWRAARNYIATGYGHRHADEPEIVQTVSVSRRRLRALQAMLVAIAVVGVAAMVAASLHWLTGQMANLLYGGAWPQESAPPPVIVLWYSTVVAIHFVKTLIRLGNDWPDCVYHAVVTGFGIWIVVWNGTGIDRLHHDFLGLLLQVFPYTSTKLLGFEYMLDSMLYHVSSNRTTDFANVIVAYPRLVALSLFWNMLPQLVNWYAGKVFERYRLALIAGGGGGGGGSSSVDNHCSIYCEESGCVECGQRKRSNSSVGSGSVNVVYGDSGEEGSSVVDDGTLQLVADETSALLLGSGRRRVP